MSQVDKGRTFPKMGKVFPTQELEREYALVIALALREELGGSHHSIKTAMRWTGARERTVKNWLSAHSGPSGAHLVGLIRNSDTVCDAVLTAAGRARLAPLQKLIQARKQIESMLETIRGLTD